MAKPAVPYTDYLGNPVHVGDLIVYPVASGSSAATLTTARIEEIDDIIPNDPSDPKNRRGHLHKDRNVQHPPYRDIPGMWIQPMPGSGGRLGDYIRDDSKAYMLKVSRLHDGGPYEVDSNRRVTIKNVDRIVVITSLVSA